MTSKADRVAQREMIRRADMIRIIKDPVPGEDCTGAPMIFLCQDCEAIHFDEVPKKCRECDSEEFDAYVQGDVYVKDLGWVVH